MTEQVMLADDSQRNDSDANILIKHSASIQITNRISMIARRISNVLLANARRTSPATEIHEIEIAALRKQIRYNSRNSEHLYEAIKSLFDTRVRYNIFKKDSNTWGELHLLAEYQISDDKILRYAYPPSIRSKLMSPNLYARLDLTVQNLLSSKHSLAIWEYLTDALGAKRSSALILLPIVEFRELMSLGPGEYEEFADLNKRVLRRAVEDLNTHTRLRVQVDVRRKGRKPEALVFRVSRATNGDQDAGSLPKLERNRDPMDGRQCVDTSSGADCNAVEDSLTNTLNEEFGVSANVAAQICRTYDLDEIRANLEIIRYAIKKKQIGNVAAYTVGALKRNLANTSSETESITANEITEKVRKRNSKSVDLKLMESVAISKIKQWYEGLETSKQQRLKDLFIAGLSGPGMDPVRASYLKDGPSHPDVENAFFVHLAKKRSNQ